MSSGRGWVHGNRRRHPPRPSSYPHATHHTRALADTPRIRLSWEYRHVNRPPRQFRHMARSTLNTTRRYRIEPFEPLECLVNYLVSGFTGKPKPLRQ
ncbi:hypothetical protein THER5_1952 [Bifidobacterium thermacidophilum subsp. thermacidophilum]|uniref:Transposase n=1 Tax=Bifidobacterium thermacidophilum subsp. thermacidophilum TaxID=79262 RepID=A0A087EAQ9_9BIFI|nr:hypothetical protein THER5_1952 [Bifidobacterium thermacidophilum subsp. thermacidophilum]